MESYVNNFLSENIDLKVKDKQKVKIYSNNFLGQFIHKDPKIDSDKQDKGKGKFLIKL